MKNYPKPKLIQKRQKGILILSKFLEWINFITIQMKDAEDFKIEISDSLENPQMGKNLSLQKNEVLNRWPVHF